MYDKKEHYEKPYYQSSVILLFTLQVQAGITLAHGAHCCQVRSFSFFLRPKFFSLVMNFIDIQPKTKKALLTFMSTTDKYVSTNHQQLKTRTMKGSMRQ